MRLIVSGCTRPGENAGTKGYIEFMNTASQIAAHIIDGDVQTARELVHSSGRRSWSVSEIKTVTQACVAAERKFGLKHKLAPLSILGLQ